MIRSLRVILCIISFGTCALAQTQLNGAGATFPYPMYSKWFNEYHNLHPDIAINYQSIGSGGGIRQVTAGTVDFGASDGPMTNEQIAASKIKLMHRSNRSRLRRACVQHSRRHAGSEVHTRPFGWHLHGQNLELERSGDCQGKSGHQVPQPEHHGRAPFGRQRHDLHLDRLPFEDKSEWQGTTGKGTSVKWPVGVGGKGNEGVAGMIRQLPGSVGYIELIYAVQNKIPYGSVKNSSGNFVKASLESTTAAAAGVKMPADFRVSITNSPAKNAYPIASFTWLLVPTNPTDANKGKILKDFLFWMLGPGQSMTEALSYAPLPKEVVEMEKTAITKQIH